MKILITDWGELDQVLPCANIPFIQNAQKNLINPKVIPKKYYG